MTVLNVPEMHCERCVERITNALKAKDLNFSVSLSDRTVTVDGCSHCVETAVEALDNLGFEAKVLS